MRGLRAALLLAALAGPSVAAQAQSTKERPYPKSGVDFSGIDQFYRIADILARDVEPSEEQWRALMSTPGYMLVEIDNKGIRGRIDVALKPSLSGQRDASLERGGNQAASIQHIVRAVARRDVVMQTRAELERTISDSIAKALPATKRFLPPNTVERAPTPFIAFAIFAPDGYAQDPGVLLDPLYIGDSGLVELLSHELHHMYASAIDRTLSDDEQAAMKPALTDVSLYYSIVHLRNEGIADMTDKPHPRVASNPREEAVVARYNAAYDRTPALLHTFDSLLVAVADDPSAARRTGARAQGLFPSNGHPNGAYMARTILETFGVDSLIPGLRSPIGFLKTYAAAESKRGNPPPFSPKAMSMLDGMEKRYLKP